MPAKEIVGLTPQAFQDVSDVVLWFFQNGLDKRVGGRFRNKLQNAIGTDYTDYVGPFSCSLNSGEAVITIKGGFVNIGTVSYGVDEKEIEITIADDNPWYIYVETKRVTASWTNTILSSQTRPDQTDDPEYGATQRIILALVNVVYDEETPADSYVDGVEQWWQAGDLFVYDRLVT